MPLTHEPQPPGSPLPRTAASLGGHTVHARASPPGPGWSRSATPPPHPSCPPPPHPAPTPRTAPAASTRAPIATRSIGHRSTASIATPCPRRVLRGTPLRCALSHTRSWTPHTRSPWARSAPAVPAHPSAIPRLSSPSPGWCRSDGHARPRPCPATAMQRRPGRQAALKSPPQRQPPPAPALRTTGSPMERWRTRHRPPRPPPPSRSAPRQHPGRMCMTAACASPPRTNPEPRTCCSSLART
mmetsp:Transcript_27794/g.89564  ORF Transcript_27794/g.89564 Transcript_27794/m.89564 type:complete len:242 (+) Transcript_27794:5214-5939(+)